MKKKRDVRIMNKNNGSGDPTDRTTKKRGVKKSKMSVSMSGRSLIFSFFKK